MRRAATVAAGVLAVGCAKSNGDRVESSKTFVLEKGAEPRYMLRYDLAPDSAQTVDVIADMDVDAPGAIEHVRMPRIVMIEDLAVGKVDAAGAHLSITMTDVRLDDRPGAMHLPASAIGFDQIKGLRYTATMQPNGLLRDLAVDASSVSDAVRDQMRQTEQLMDQMTAVLPDVPVGKGAKWRVETTVREGGIKMRFETLYEVVDVSEHGATVHQDTDLTADAQTIHTSAGNAKLDSMTGHVSADVTIDLAHVVGRMTGSYATDLSLSADGQHADMSMKMALQMLPDGEKPAPPAPEPDKTGGTIDPDEPPP